MKGFILNEETKNYFNRRINDYERGKLSKQDEKQLFQDLHDSGYFLSLPQYYDFIKRLINVGLIVSPINKVLQ